METIVVTTDFSARSTRALDRAEAIAGATGAGLLIVHAVDDDLPASVVEHMVEESDGLLKDEEIRRGRRVAVTTRVVIGDVFYALRAAAIDARADLLIVGDHRRSPLRDAFWDTTAERLIRVSPCPVLVSRVASAGRHRHAVLGIESDEAPDLLEAVSRLADCRPGRITAVHAYEAIGSSLLLFAGATRAEVTRYEQEKADAVRKEVVSRIGRPVDHPFDVKIMQGDPKSSESFTPHFSRGWRDDAIQRAYLEATYLWWGEAANNPISGIYGGRMVHVPECAAWAWDARPDPYFPALTTSGRTARTGGSATG